MAETKKQEERKWTCKLYPLGWSPEFKACQDCEKFFPDKYNGCKSEVNEMLHYMDERFNMTENAAVTLPEGTPVNPVTVTSADVAAGKKKREKSVRSKFKHGVETSGGYIDQCLEAGSTINKIVEGWNVNHADDKITRGRVNSHMKHLQESHKAIINKTVDAENNEIFTISVSA